jgi:hypothetical protein
MERLQRALALGAILLLLFALTVWGVSMLIRIDQQPQPIEQSAPWSRPDAPQRAPAPLQ